MDEMSSSLDFRLVAPRPGTSSGHCARSMFSLALSNLLILPAVPGWPDTGLQQNSNAWVPCAAIRLPAHGSRGNG
eukprot:6114451-Pleurochrysis_carterae.AAC.2